MMAFLSFMLEMENKGYVGLVNELVREKPRMMTQEDVHYTCEAVMMTRRCMISQRMECVR
jgi:hypothetical protein